MADLAPESVLLCEWCDEEIDAIDVSVEAFEVMGGPCCTGCHRLWLEESGEYNGQFGVGA
jgi:hypothetical protein